MTETDTTVVAERTGPVGWLAIDRPDEHNAIDRDALAALTGALESFEAETAVRAVVLHPGEASSFSAGADVAGLHGAIEPDEAVAVSRAGQETFGAFERSPLPVVAAVDGFCLGGGMELAACADLRIATPRARFGQPERTFGLLPGWGGTQRLPRIVGEGRAREIVLTGDRYEPETMREYGFLTEVCDAAALSERAEELARDLAGGPPLAQAAVKRALLAGRESPEAGFEAEAQAFGRLFDSEDAAEGVAAFEADREPEFEGR